MADHHEISRGIIQVLSRHLRNRVRDLNQAKQHIQELENRLEENHDDGTITKP
jgi:hypothetical protein